MKILLVDDTKTERLILTAYLQKLDHEVVTAENGQQAIELFRSESPDLVLMDVIMPEMDGHEASRRIREDESVWAPIIFLSGRVAVEDIVAGIESGGDDYLTKPVDFRVLEAKMKALQRIAQMRRKLLDVSVALESANAELKKQVNLDGLTGLSNRRYLDQFMDISIRRGIRNSEQISVALIDVDHFKKYNDSQGHLQGDDCLKEVATALSKACKRSTDLVARYGGEEFCAVLPETSVENAVKVAEAMRHEVESLNIAHPLSEMKKVTVSIGVYGMTPEAPEDVENILQKADEALYVAKESGRNQVKVSDQA